MWSACPTFKVLAQCSMPLSRSANLTKDTTMNMTQNELNGKTLSFGYVSKKGEVQSRCIVVGAINSGQRVWGRRSARTGAVLNDNGTKAYITGFDKNDEGQFKTFELSRIREVMFGDAYWLGNRE